MFSLSDINETHSDPWALPALSLSTFQKFILDLLRDVTEPFNFLCPLGMGTDTKLKITLMLCLVTEARRRTELETKASRQNASKHNDKW